MDFRNYFRELKRRNVFKAALAYLVIGWIILQVVAIVFPMFNIPDWMSKAVFLILLLGFPVWLVFAWIYEISPEGLKRTEAVPRQEAQGSKANSRFNIVIVGALVIAIVLLGTNLFLGINNKHSSELPGSDPSSGSEKVSSIESKTSKKSVAVLAFENMSADKDQEYFSDGISEEILNSLAKIPELKVISRTSSFAYKDTNTKIKTIARELGVAYVLEGSVRKAGNQVRITAQLINSKDGAHIWSQTFDRELKDIFQIQEEIAREVTENLKASVLDISVKRTSPEAYTLYLRAAHEFRKFTDQGFEESLRLLKESTRVDPQYAPAWSLMSRIYYRMGFMSPTFEKEKAYELGLAAVKKAIAVDPQFATAYLNLATYNRLKFQFSKSKRHLNKALELEPENTEAIVQRGLYTFASNEEILGDIRKSIELDPLNPAHYFRLGFQLYWMGKNKEALDALEEYQAQVPQGISLYATKAEVLLAQNLPERALEEVKKETSEYFRDYVTIKVLYGLGEKDKANRELQEFIEAYPAEAANIADIYAYMGKREKTFEWLQRAITIEDSSLSEVIYYPTFKKFHDDPRWQQLIKEMGVPKDNGVPGIK